MVHPLCSGKSPLLAKDARNGAPGFVVLHVAEVYCFAQGFERISGRHEFMRDVAFESCVRDAAHHPVPLDFLRVVEFMAARDATAQILESRNLATAAAQLRRSGAL